jgi:putative flippase GtrA
VNEEIAQAMSIVAATPLNFLGNKMWSFGSSVPSRRS